jgi:hypothetical protein
MNIDLEADDLHPSSSFKSVTQDLKTNPLWIADNSGHSPLLCPSSGSQISSGPQLS